MPPERWQQIDRLLEQALEQEPVSRNVFLDSACGGDDELRREVETLLAAHDHGGGLLSSPALEAAPERLAADLSKSLVGQDLSHYRILSLLGQGSMGVVYKARDQQLDQYGFAVSPDERWILYAQVDQEPTADLMLVENFR